MKNQTLKRLGKLLKPQTKTIIIISILSLFVSIAELLKPYIVKIVIDDYLSKGVYEKGIWTIGLLGAIYIGIVLIGNIINFIATTTTNMMGENIIYQLRNKLYRYIQYANISFHDKTPAGKLFVRITNDVEDIATFFKEVIITLFKDILLIILLVFIMMNISTKLSLLTLIVVPFIIVTSLVITRALNRIYAYSKTIRTNLNTFLAESIYGIKLIKIFNIQQEKRKECEEYTKQFLKSRKPTGILEGLLPAIMTLLENVAISIIVVSAVNAIWGIHLEVGVIYMFITYVKQIFEPINRTIENTEVIQESVTSLDKIYEILEHKEYLENLETGKEIERLQGKIEFKHVWFAYTKDNWVLKDVSFIIHPGESIALVGKTGSGKTTITNLINRFYEIQKGEILIDDINIKDINIRSLRKNVGIILQDPFIFARTIKDNIRMEQNLDDEEIEKAITLASADGFVNSLPNGIEEVSKERGITFSMGEKQLLAFARIFAHNPSIFILDEATSNIDTHTEQLIQKSVDKISQDKTSIFIAHRLSTIVNVDKIIVLNHGKIIEQGSHEELLQNKEGYYSKLYRSYYAALASN